MESGHAEVDGWILLLRVRNRIDSMGSILIDNNDACTIKINTKTAPPECGP